MQSDTSPGAQPLVSWGSRTLYEWTASGKQLDAQPNQSHLLDYQDCDYVSRSKQLCGGVTDGENVNGTELFVYESPIG